MSMIIAKKEDGTQRTFTSIQWNLLGRNKNGWIQVESQVIVSNLNTGEKKKEIIVDLTEQIDSFVKTAAGISKSDLKKYLESNKIIFDESMKSKDLVLLLGELNKYDLSFFKNNF